MCPFVGLFRGIERIAVLRRIPFSGMGERDRDRPVQLSCREACERRRRLVQAAVHHHIVGLLRDGAGVVFL